MPVERLALEQKPEHAVGADDEERARMRSSCPKLREVMPKPVERADARLSTRDRFRTSDGLGACHARQMRIVNRRRLIAGTHPFDSTASSGLRGGVSGSSIGKAQAIFVGDRICSREPPTISLSDQHTSVVAKRFRSAGVLR